MRTRDLPGAVIADCDGTLVDVAGIRPLIDGPGRFHAFHMASVNCPPNQWAIDELREHHAAGRAILIVTARQARYRHVTAWWLALHGVPSEAMWMRATNDSRPDHIVKAEILAKIRREWNPIHAYDDRPEVVEVWERAGIPVTVVPGWGDTARQSQL